MSDDVEIWDEVIKDNTLDEYIDCGGSVSQIVKRAIDDMCHNYCKYIDAADDVRNLMCHDCPLRVLE